jgi:hypothetical protein
MTARERLWQGSGREDAPVVRAQSPPGEDGNAAALPPLPAPSPGTAAELPIGGDGVSAVEPIPAAPAPLPDPVLPTLPAAADPPGRTPPANASASPESLRGLSSIARNRAAAAIENKTDFPDIHDEPGARYGLTTDQYDRFLFPWAMNLIHEDLWLLERDANRARELRLKRSARVDIRDPDPDTANFPNGAYTLPKGRFYIENSPVGFYGRSLLTPPQYNWEFLLRYGLTHNLEFRIFSNGFTATTGKNATTGFSPLAFDFKINFWEENIKYHIPAAGVEIYINTNFGSRAFNGGTQPSLNLLFDHTLPFAINFEHNFSMSGRQGILGESIYQFGYSWSFQREVVKDFDVFVHGFYNASSLPRVRNLLASDIISRDMPLLGRHPTTVVVGAGAIWTVNNRLAIFGSYNFGLTRFSPSIIAQLGFAVAF